MGPAIRVSKGLHIFLFAGLDPFGYTVTCRLGKPYNDRTTTARRRRQAIGPI